MVLVKIPSIQKKIFFARFSNLWTNDLNFFPNDLNYFPKEDIMVLLHMNQFLSIETQAFD